MFYRQPHKQYGPAWRRRSTPTAAGHSWRAHRDLGRIDAIAFGTPFGFLKLLPFVFNLMSVQEKNHLACSPMSTCPTAISRRAMRFGLIHHCLRDSIWSSSPFSGPFDGNACSAASWNQQLTSFLSQGEGIACLLRPKGLTHHVLQNLLHLTLSSRSKSSGKRLFSPGTKLSIWSLPALLGRTTAVSSLSCTNLKQKKTGSSVSIMIPCRLTRWSLAFMSFWEERSLSPTAALCNNDAVAQDGWETWEAAEGMKERSLDVNENDTESILRSTSQVYCSLAAVSSAAASFMFGFIGLEELRASTDGFSPEHIVSEHGQKAPNVVYQGRLFPGDRAVAIKRFNKFAWPDARQFLVGYIRPSLTLLPLPPPPPLWRSLIWEWLWWRRRRRGRSGSSGASGWLISSVVAARATSGC
ncbi:hypothetical protein BHE74_00020988 [Ensete ventricosum]|nr:hypothetical protein BHE74_00020988 [Ensete ventricosum]